jgi:hypothetical protein
VFLVLGLFFIAASALCLFGAATSWWERQKISRWPAADATIQHCSIEKHKRRNSVQFAYSAECSITFNAGSEVVKGGFDSIAAYYEHRPKSWGNPGIDELRGWIAKHPEGSKISVHYDPDWHPSAVPYPTDPLFDRTSNTVMVKAAGILAAIGVALAGLPLTIPR